MTPTRRLGVAALAVGITLWLIATAVSAATLAERTSQNEPTSILTSSSGIVFSHLRMALTCSDGELVSLDMGALVPSLVPVTNGAFDHTTVNGRATLRVAGVTSGTNVLGRADATFAYGGSQGVCRASTTIGDGHRTVPSFRTRYAIHGVPGHPREGRLVKLILRPVPRWQEVWYGCRRCHGPANLRTTLQRQHGWLVLRFVRRVILTPRSLLIVGWQASGEVERFRTYTVNPYTVGLHYVSQFCAPPGESIQQLDSLDALRPLYVPC